MKKFLLGTAALFAMPVAAAHAQSSPIAPTPGAYFGIETGLNWLLTNGSYQSQTGYALGGKLGYDFVGPRVELEGMYRNNISSGWVNFPGAISYVNGQINQFALMGNALYDFTPGAKFVPYVGAGIGVAFIDPSVSAGCTMCSTQFAYQAIGGIGYNAAPNVRFNLETRYYGTTNGNSYSNNDISLLVGATYKFGVSQ
ncbi:Opacity protein [Enhydrobacter aerosaccus]|uniref:Opacity protein n=1 Tax=Enhydrobacter aerosaccus TaxID=225324 RepID=A0A1T4PBF4_9HYPH|nr:acyloxyacyl hydrolase [Enhydrobacter aerosaccus]SJZ88895.1 Opacity protein [Enhydrobacter aerosaccus]